MLECLLAFASCMHTKVNMFKPNLKEVHTHELGQPSKIIFCYVKVSQMVIHFPYQLSHI